MVARLTSRVSERAACHGILAVERAADLPQRGLGGAGSPGAERHEATQTWGEGGGPSEIGQGC